MIGLVCLYYIIKSYSGLAREYNKKRWLYVILGILSFYGGALLFGLIYIVYAEITGNYGFYELDDFIIELIVFPFCLATCILFYMLLRHIWSRKDVITTLDDWEI